MSATFRRIGILGTGLIGASIGMRAKRHGHVLGFDTRTENAEAALARNAIDDVAGREELYEHCDLVVIATPPKPACDELKRLANAHHNCEVIIDVASVKVPIVEAASELEGFVATHPLAGNEGSGPGAASPDLFEGRSWAYIPSGSAERDAGACAFIKSLGAEPFACKAEHHDHMVAVTSHLPQLLAWALAKSMRDAGDDYEKFCGPAGREFLRLARSRPELWSEILDANSENVAAAIERLVPLIGEEFRRAGR